MKKSEISKNLKAYNAIKELVAGRKLSPGQKLIYRDLEEALGMSKTPIINGLMRLEQEGLVVSKRNRGFFMREVSASEAEQIYDLREKLEEISISYAIRNHDRDDLNILKEKLNHYNNYSAHTYDRKRLELDTEFHMQITKMGKNEFFTSMIKQFYENIYFTLNVVYLSSYIDSFKKEHELVFNAIRKRNLKEAKKVLRIHTRAARKLLVAALDA
ncbi:MAG: GntR family transcriptional regulator [Alphaproteobacteria bacterium]|nr:GntR family transcriptional regulator [Alphaproteobacteria bacterium]